MLNSKILFNDKDVKVREECITIKNYYDRTKYKNFLALDIGTKPIPAFTCTNN